MQVGSDRTGAGDGVLGPADPQVLWVRVFEVRRAQQAPRGAVDGRAAGTREAAGAVPDGTGAVGASRTGDDTHGLSRWCWPWSSCKGSCCTGTCCTRTCCTVGMAATAGPAEEDGIAMAGVACMVSRPSSTATSSSVRPPAARVIALLLLTGQE